jgi:hypothetical protein
VIDRHRHNPGGSSGDRRLPARAGAAYRWAVEFCSKAGTVLGRYIDAAADVAEAFARYGATRKNPANTVQIFSRQKAEVLMEYADKDAIPFCDTGGPPSYDPAIVPIATKEETVMSSTIEESRC